MSFAIEEATQDIFVDALDGTWVTSPVTILEVGKHTFKISGTDSLSGIKESLLITVYIACNLNSMAFDGAAEPLRSGDPFWYTIG